jgi:hypothetical protein
LPSLTPRRRRGGARQRVNRAVSLSPISACSPSSTGSRPASSHCSLLIGGAPHNRVVDATQPGCVRHTHRVVYAAQPGCVRRTTGWGGSHHRVGERLTTGWGNASPPGGEGLTTGWGGSHNRVGERLTTGWGTPHHRVGNASPPGGEGGVAALQLAISSEQLAMKDYSR